MSDLISRSALMDALQKEEKDCEDCMIMPSWYSAMKVIKEAPTVEAKSLVHGEWKGIGNCFYFTYKCSACGELEEFKTNFCPSCGADMRGGKNENNL